MRSDCVPVERRQRGLDRGPRKRRCAAEEEESCAEHRAPGFRRPGVRHLAQPDMGPCSRSKALCAGTGRGTFRGGRKAGERRGAERSGRAAAFRCGSAGPGHGDHSESMDSHTYGLLRVRGHARAREGRASSARRRRRCGERGCRSGGRRFRRRNAGIGTAAGPERAGPGARSAACRDPWPTETSSSSAVE